MNEESVLRALTGLRLSVAGRNEEALVLMPRETPGLRAFVAHRAKVVEEAPPGPLGDVVRGWGAYYRAEYVNAYRLFYAARLSDVPWVRAYAFLGIGKVCTDLGFLARAALWCQQASAVAREIEHDDLVAAAQGAHGEALLRAGCPRLALEAFTLDLGLLSAGDKFRGRVLCCQAHAYRRLEAYSAAKLGYRISAHLPGEDTAPYAYAGLASLGADTSDKGLVEEACGYAKRLQQTVAVHVSLAWIYVARAWQERRDREAFASWLHKARIALPRDHVFEHRWLAQWLIIIGQQPAEKVQAAAGIEDFVPESPEADCFLLDRVFDGEILTGDVFDTGFRSLQWATNQDELWEQRLLFMH